MSDRFTWMALGFFALSGSGFAQSTVRQLPLAAMIPAAGFELAAGSATASSTPFAKTPPRTSDWDFLDAIPLRPESDTYAELDVFGRAQASADFESDPGSVTIQRGGWEARIGRRVEDGTSLSLRVRTEASFYDFGSASGLIPGTDDPFNDVYETRLGAGIVTAYSSTTSFFTGVEVVAGGEDDVDLEDALYVGGVGGVRYQAGDELSLSFGLAAQSRLEDDARVWPFLGFDWRVAERTRLSTEGFQINLTHELNDAWSLIGSASYQSRQYRLNDDNPLPSGVNTDEEIALSGGVQWSPRENMRLELIGGAMVWKELAFFDDSGSKLGENETDLTEFVAFGLRLSF